MAIAIVLFFLLRRIRYNSGIIFVAALVSGTIMAFESPTRMTFVMDLVDDLPSALALNQAMFNSAQGRSSTRGYDCCHWHCSCVFSKCISFFAVIASIYMMKFPKTEPVVVQHPPLLKGLKEGFQLSVIINIYCTFGDCGYHDVFSWPIATLLPICP